MIKKTKLENATAKIAGAERPTGIAAIWYGIKWLLYAVFVRIPRAIWNWVRNLDILGLANAALLILIIILFAILIGQVWTRGGDKAKVETPAPTVVVPVRGTQAAPIKHIVKTVDVPAQVTIDSAKDKLTIALPLRPIARPIIENAHVIDPAAKIAPAPTIVRPVAKPTVKVRVKKTLIAEVQTIGDVVIGTRGGEMIKSGANIRGNLYLQDMRYYTLPCNVRVEGSLYLRDVGLLKFCGPFTVTGNIYVSRSSSFGPIPRDARLGGQVIF